MDINIYNQIESQTTKEDKTSLLVIISWLKKRYKNYSYLEIGSHLGGTIQPFLSDEQCVQIYSIDKRPKKQPDERGRIFYYDDNSTAKMLELLSKIDSKSMSKIITFDSDASKVKKGLIKSPPMMCFIDGEHTDKAALKDFKFCQEIVDSKGIIVFHDANIVFNAIGKILKTLDESSISYRAFVMPSSIFVISFEEEILDDELILKRISENYSAYLFGLNNLNPYRKFAIKKGFSTR